MDIAHLVRAQVNTPPDNVRRLLREPLLHFLVLGVLLFASYAGLHRGARDAPEDIVVTRDQRDALRLQFERTWQRPPAPEEMQGLLDAWVHDEVLYREGLALGLDRDDVLVRRRVVQKMAFISEAAPAPAPSEAELQAWLSTHPDAYRIEPTYALRQIYFDPARHPGTIEADVAAARASLERGDTVEGDATMLPGALDATTAFDVARVFGPEFVASLATMPIGRWHGPVRSGYGVHLVDLRAREPGRVPPLAQVRAAVERDVLEARTARANAAFYRDLRARYTVRIEGESRTVDAAAPDATSAGIALGTR